MGLKEGSASLRKGKHLNRDERIQIEGLWKAGYPPSQIALILGRHVRTIERELERGCVEHLQLRSDPLGGLQRRQGSRCP